jgi:hypothetical protein
MLSARTLVDQDTHPGEGDQYANRYSGAVGGGGVVHCTFTSGKYSSGSSVPYFSCLASCFLSLDVS